MGLNFDPIAHRAAGSGAARIDEQNSSGPQRAIAMSRPATREAENSRKTEKTSRCICLEQQKLIALSQHRRQSTCDAVRF